MRYCTNCGEQIPKDAKFCAFCGEKQTPLEPIREEHKTPPIQQVEPRHNHNGDDSPLPDGMLLEPGSDFRGYHVVRTMNKDMEGIKYIVEKDGGRYILKLFFKSRLTSLDTIYALQMRLSRLNKLEDSHTARVVEVNQSHDPAYMVSRFVEGKSLAQIKNTEPDRLTEPFVRDIAIQLVKTAMAVRKQGLTISNLSLHGVMINANGNLVILSSGITYEEVDEREDAFAIGTILAQILSTNRLFSTFYTPERLRASKFAYIQGVTLSMNKVLAECLHRNITQRYGSLGALLHDLENLPPTDTDEVWSTTDKNPSLLTDKLNDVPKPKAPIEIGFVIIVAAVVLIVILLITTDVFGFLFSKQNKTNTRHGRSGAARNTEAGNQPGDAIRDSLYGRERNGQSFGNTFNDGQRRVDPRMSAYPSRATDRGSSATAQRAPAPNPSTMVRIDAGSFSFGNPSKNTPALTFSISIFYIGRHEVTQGEWNQLMTPVNISDIDNNAPVHNISWIKAIEYCNKLSEREGLEPVYTRNGSKASGVVCNWNANGYRLPTEAEWEMAAKAGTGNIYSGSNDPNAVAWYKDNSITREGDRQYYRISKVAQRSPNNWGLYDMSGNVAEWCWDWYTASPGSLMDPIDPRGPASGSEKVIRGGKVTDGAGDALKLISRSKAAPDAPVKYVGLRLVRTR